MHLMLILAAIALAILSRLIAKHRPVAPAHRWTAALGPFLFAPLLLLCTVVAVFCMGREGHMLGLSVGSLGWVLAVGSLTLAGGMLLRLGGQVGRSRRTLQTLPFVETHGLAARLLDTPALFAAQVGFWQPELVVSRGLLETLSAEQVAAVLAHEQAHTHYRDTFWFFWLGWLRGLTAWLPHTEALWQELLRLRELRADRWAAQHVDPLLLAESLVQVVRSPLTEVDFPCAAFGEAASPCRLAERIEALLPDAEGSLAGSIERDRLPWLWLLASGLPLCTLLIHH
ncbi:M56 family metallopeptidase [Thermoleptolyngbya sp. M55_K2018_002]|uniref:M56 family metallopeptidase n=1 Tax=Thermoleptolyngbya sp. M55_K2018_002 TaxID=2747808 RepID=UPI001A08D08F|nr:M56 family metallopeptidase [Thermoleptolyngbya sp. M55_K2018_002]HIK39830.1 M56 family metallopeptidase [Thermoleptolyngbya sp. M55_K2018_002]